MSARIPKTHRAARFTENGKPLVIEEIETKQPKQGEVLVKVKACGVCSSDAAVQHEHMGVKLYVPLKALTDPSHTQ